MSTPPLDDVAKALCQAHGYTLQRAAGHGAFKQTFLVQQADGTEVALKIYPPDAFDERSERETEAMLRCSHPNIAKLAEIATFDFGGQTHKYTLEEFISGGTLTERLRTQGLMSAADVKALAVPLIAAIANIASNGLVHRDLKPDNIMLRADGSPVIVDFGLVRTLNRASLTPTWQPTGPGTPWFAAPEQLNNEKSLIDWRTDQFSLGVVLAHCLLERHPYAMVGDTPGQTVGRVGLRSGPDVDFIAAVRATGLDPLIRLVAPWPVGRFRTPADLAQAWS